VAPDQDTYQLLWHNGSLRSEITDFESGASGDVIDLSWTLKHALTGYVGGTIRSPLASCRLINDGSGNTLLQIDSNGTVGGAEWVRL